MSQYELICILQACHLGLSAEQYVKNKQLPLAEKLKLPVFEFLCAIWVAEPNRKYKKR